jgi:hypothetical protein
MNQGNEDSLDFTGVPLDVCPLGCLVDHEVPGDECLHMTEPEVLPFEFGAVELSSVFDEKGMSLSLWANFEAEIKPGNLENAAQQFERVAAALRAFGAGEAVETS